MYKSYFFLEGAQGIDPFCMRAQEAADALSDLLPEAAGYVQTRTLTEAVDAAEPAPFLGIAELWFADKSFALDSARQARLLGSLLTPDVRVGPVVTGRARTVMRLPDHHQVGSIKGVFPFRCLARLTVAEFQRYWWLNHGPIAAQTEQALYYLQCHPLAESYTSGLPPYDSITELHWRDIETAKKAMNSRQMTQDQSQDAKNFVDTNSVLLFFAHEEIVLEA